MKENLLCIQQEQNEKLRELGSCLRQVRQERLISLDDVAAKTRIQSRLLRAIEDGRQDELPEPIYIKGFIKQFADALGLNGAEFAESFPAKTILPAFRPSWQRWSGNQLRPIHLYLLYVFLVIGSVNGLSYLMNRSAIEASRISSSNQLTAQPKKSHQSQAPILEKLGTLSSIETSKDGNVSKQVRVGVTVKAASWVRVVADGKTMFEGELPTGSQLTWVADEQLTVRADNAGGVLVAFNNEKAKKLGAPGTEQEVTFAANAKKS